MTDADDVKRKIDVHEGLKDYVIKELQDNGIECKETDWYDRNGDILIVNIEDVPQARKIVQRLKQKFSK